MSFNHHSLALILLVVGYSLAAPQGYKYPEPAKPFDFTNSAAQANQVSGSEEESSLQSEGTSGASNSVGVSHFTIQQTGSAPAPVAASLGSVSASQSSSDTESTAVGGFGGQASFSSGFSSGASSSSAFEASESQSGQSEQSSGGATEDAAEGAGEIIAIVSDDRVNPDETGAYQFSYESADGSKRSEQGQIGANGGISQTGEYTYLLPDGQTFTLTYIADEQGFRVESPFIPPLPQYVQEQIDFAAAHPEITGEEESASSGSASEASAAASESASGTSAGASQFGSAFGASTGAASGSAFGGSAGASQFGSASGASTGGASGSGSASISGLSQLYDKPE